MKRKESLSYCIVIRNIIGNAFSLEHGLLVGTQMVNCIT